MRGDTKLVTGYQDTAQSWRCTNKMQGYTDQKSLGYLHIESEP